MKLGELAYRLAWAVFYFLAIVVAWNTAASEGWRFLSETNRKLIAIIGLCIYALLYLERKARSERSDL